MRQRRKQSKEKDKETLEKSVHKCLSFLLKVMIKFKANKIPKEFLIESNLWRDKFLFE